MTSLLFPATPGEIHVRRTLVTRTASSEADDGREFRVGKYPVSRYRYEVRFNFLRISDAYREAQRIWRHFVQHGGRRESFLLRDPDDYAVTDHGFGVGDASKTKFPLQRTPVGDWQDVLGTWETYTKPRTNLLLRSQEFGTTWTAGNVAVTANQAVGPDGSLTADLMVENTTPTVTHQVGQSLTWTQGGTATFSVYAKQGPGTRWLSLQARTSGGLFPFAGFNLSTGATAGVSNATATLTSLGNGWWRAAITFATGTGATSPNVWCFLSTDGTNPGTTYTGDGSSGLYLWGAQVEMASAPTRYIPTTTAAVRADPSYWTADQTTGALVAPGTPDGFEPVTEPDWATITIYKDGVAQTPGTAFTFTPAGLVTFTAAPASGAVLSWTGNFHRRVRFDDDEADFERMLNDVKSGVIELVSVI